jgi:serine/threonine-protein kinase RsbW
VDEACANIVEHAYGGGDGGEISITCGIGDVQGEAFFLVRLEDQGEPFDPDSVPAPRLTEDPEELKIGGLGIHFMQKMMDRVEYRFYPGRNELVMYKRLDREAK